MFRLPENVKRDLADYKDSLNQLVRGEISADGFKPTRALWGIYPQRKGTHYMVRVRLPAGIIQAAQLKALARAATQYGDGALHVTTRQDIQIHNVRNLGDTHAMFDELKELDVSSRGGCGDAVRNITACPLAGLCSEEVMDVRPFAVGLTEWMLKAGNSYHLPRKFKIAFSGCSRNCALATATDLGFIAYQDPEGRSHYKVYAGGGLGAHSVLGQVLVEKLEPGQAGCVAEAVKRVFDRYGGRQNRYRSRLRFLMEKIGFAKFRELFHEELKKLEYEGPVVLRNVVFSQPPPAEKQQDIPPREDNDFALWKKHNFQNQTRPNDAILEIRLELGDLRAEQALALADLCSAHPGIEIRASQSQNLLLCHVPAKDVYPIYAHLRAVNLARPYAATVADVISCAGATTCTLGICNSKGVAREISSLIEQEGLDFEILRDIRIKISGCPNSCSQHPVAMVGLQGLARRVGERMVPYYRIFAGGSVIEGQSKLAGEMGTAPARNIPRLMVDFLKEAERALPACRDFYEFIDKQGAALFAGLAEKYAYVPAYEEDSSFYKDWGKTEDFSLAETTPNQ